MNGGKCVDIENPKDKKFGFKCKCPAGYSGELCEQCNLNQSIKQSLFFINLRVNSVFFKDNSSPCIPNPCPDNLQCIKNGQLSYFCTNNTSTVYVRRLLIN